MKNKTLQEQYNLIKEGQGNKDVFLKEAKRQFPKLIRNAAGLNETVDKLKTKSIISENYVDLAPLDVITRNEESWETKFKQFMAEAKKEQPLNNQFDYNDKKNLDNHIGTEVLNGITFEAKKSPEKNIEEIKAIVVKNLQKDPLFYMNNALYGIDGLGAKQEEAMAASGKHAGSGYGDKLTKLVKEALSKEKETLVENFTLAGYMQEVLNELNEDEEEDAKNDADYEAGWTDDPRFDEGEEMPMDEDGFLEGEETNEITAEVEEEIEKDTKGKKAKKETVQKTLQRIEQVGSRQALEAKCAAIDEEITKRNEQLGMIDENDAMAELMDQKKLKEMKKDIKVLEKAKMKYEKMLAKASK